MTVEFALARAAHLTGVIIILFRFDLLLSPRLTGELLLHRVVN